MPNNLITRRAAMVSAVASSSLLAAAPLAHAASVKLDCRQKFIEQVANLHRDGRLAATIAMAAGMDPEACIMILLNLRGREVGALPALTFETPNGWRTFRPMGED